MLEKYIASLLVPYLSKYVENIDERQLNIDIWSGKATLNDLVLKKDVLNTLLSSDANDASTGGDGAAPTGSSSSTTAHKPLPVRVHRGICKSVTLDIPLTNLRSRPVVVNIGEILITLVAPDIDGASGNGEKPSGGESIPKSVRWDRVAAQKAHELEAFEEERRKHREAAAEAATAAKDGSGNANEPKKRGFFSKLGEIILNNIIVKAKAVHVRYEDAAHHVVLGAVLGGVQLLTIDDNTGEASFVDPEKVRRMGKRLELEGLQLYCDDPKHILANEALGRCWVSQMVEWQAWYHAMRQRSRDGSVALSTVFGPVTCAVDARVVFKRFVREMLDTPYMTVTAKLQHMIAHLTRSQYTTIVKSISRFTNWSEVVAVAARRPRVPVRGNAKVWWRFAVNTVMKVLREPRETRLLERVSEICRMDYQVLYRDVVRKADMSPEKRRSYRFITRFMTVEDMIAGRTHVYAQLASEIQLKRKDIETKRTEAAALAQGAAPPVAAPAKPQKKGWFQWLRGSSDTKDDGSEAHLTKEEREEEEFFRALEKDYGITAAEAGNGGAGGEDEGNGALTSTTQLPTSYAWLFLSVDLPFMSYQIDMEDGESAGLSFFQLYGQVRTFNKANSAQFHFSVQNLTLSNPATDFDGGGMITNLVEGVSIYKGGPSRSSSAASSAQSSARSKSVCVRSITDVDSGKVRPDRAPTLREMLGIAPGSAFNNESSSYTQQQQQQSPHERSSSSVSAGDAAPPSSSSATPAYATPLLSFSGALHPVEQPLADTKLDAAICVKLLPLRVVADPGTIRRIVHFFRVPRGVDLSHFTQGASSAATAVSTAASQELRTAMASAKGFFVSVDATAPIILLPKTLRATRQETTLAVSLGRIRFQTQPLTETEKAKRLNCTRETEDMLYYSNRASFSKFFVELTTLEDALNNPETGMMLIPNVAIAADVLQRIDDRNELREKVIVRLKVPKLVVATSVHQVYLLTTMIDAWIRNWTTGAASSAIEHAKRGADGLPGGDNDGGAGRMRGGGDSDDEDAEADMGYLSAVRGGSLSASLVLPARAEPGGGTSSPSPLLSSAGAFTGVSGGNANHQGKSAHASCPPRLAGRAANAPANSAGRRSGALGSGSGADVGVGSGTSSPPLATSLAGRQEDLPVLRVELLVESLGLAVHEDDPQTLTPVFPARFSLTFTNAEFIMAVRTTQKKVLLYLKKPCAVDLKDPQHPILHGTTAIRIDVGLIPVVPVSVGVLVEPSLHARVGTPLIELVETAMDIVNLIMSCIDGAAGPTPATGAAALPQPTTGSSSALLPSAANTAGGGRGGGGGRAEHGPLEEPHDDDLDTIKGIGVSPAGGQLSSEDANRQMRFLQERKATLSDLAYQLGIVRLQNAMPDIRSANISIHIDGTTTVKLLNRKKTDMADQPFASASATDVHLFVKKNSVTMEVTGKVAEASAMLSDNHGLLKENNSILSRSFPPPAAHQHSQQPQSQHSRQESAGEGAAVSSSLQGRGQGEGANGDATKEKARGQPASLPTQQQQQQQPHIAFTFRKYRPVMPIFTTQAEGKRVLANAGELRYSNEIELELDGSTATLDVHTLMLLKLYFTTGFFSRLSMLGDRPLYNGRTLPATRDGPRLLMSVRVVARDITVALPLDARRTTESFGATVGNLVVQSSLHAWEAQQTTSISLRELALWRNGGEDGGGVAHSLLPTQAYIELAMRNPIDLESDEEARLDIRSEELTVNVTSEDLLDLCRLVRQNASRAEVSASASVMVNPIKRIFAKPNNGQAPVLMTTAMSAGGSAREDSLGIAGQTPDAPYSATSVHTASAGGNSDTIIGVRFGHAALRFTGGGASFELGAAGCSLLMDPASLAMSVNWKSLELLDTRGDTTSALIRCDEGEAHMADSLTTKAIVMGDFGVRPSASAKSKEDNSTITADDEDATNRTGRPAGGGAGPESLSSSDAAASSQPFPQRPILTAAETGAGSSGRTRRARRPSLMGQKMHASAVTAPDSKLLSMSVLSVAFTLRRFAISDQWLSIYDYFCNESVAAAWAAPQAGLPDDNGSRSPARTPLDSPAPQSQTAPPSPSHGSIDGSGSTSSSSGFRCVLTTPSVVIPFLTAAREPLFEASIRSLLVDTASFPGASTQVAVKVQELEVVDGKSGEKVVMRRRPTANNGAGGVDGAAGEDVDDDDNYYSAMDEEEMGSPLVGLHGVGSFTASPPSSSQPPSQPPPQQQHGFDSAAQASANASLGNGGGRHHPASPNTAGVTAKADAKKEPKDWEALHFLFKADPEAHRHKIALSMGRLDAVCSMPMLYGMIDYFVSPTQPIARISGLGVMREQRERVARAAQEMADTNVVSIHVLWHQPRIVLVGDGMDLKNRARGLEARLGTMRASVSLDKPNNSLVTTVKVQDFSIPTLLEKSALHVSYSAKSGVEEVSVTLDRMVGLFFPAKVDHLVYVMNGNLTLPPETHYYGKFDAAEDRPRQIPPPSSDDRQSGAEVAQAADGGGGGEEASLASSTATSCSDAAGSEAAGTEAATKPKRTKGRDAASKARKTSTAAPTALRPTGKTSPSASPVSAQTSPHRTIAVQVNELHVEMHDFAGVNTHTFTLSSLSLDVNPEGDVRLVIPIISAVEHFTNSTILASGETDAAGVRVVAAAAAPDGKCEQPSGTASPAPAAAAPSAKPAIALTMTKADSVTELAVSEVVFALVPRGTGVLLNTLLSVQIPHVDVGAAAVAAAAANAKAKANSKAEDGTHADHTLADDASLGSSRPIEAPIPASKLHKSSAREGPANTSGSKAATGTPAPARSFKATLDGCGLRVVNNEVNVAFAKFTHVTVALDTYKDDSSLLYATMENFTLMDSYSLNPTTRQIVTRYVDDVDLNATSSQADAIERKLLNFTLWTAPEGDKLNRTVSISSLRREDNLYAKRMNCEVANLSFTLVPEVVKALTGTVSEVMQHVSEANKGKAYDYVSDTATAAAGAVVSKTALDLTELEVIVHRPRIVILHKADASSGIELFPGRLTVQSELGLPEATPQRTAPPAAPAKTKAAPPSSLMSNQYREVFRVRVERMGVKLLDDDAFKKDCHVNVVYQSSLPAPPSLEQLLAEVRAEIRREGFTEPLSPAAATDPPTLTGAADTHHQLALKPAATGAPYWEEAEVRVTIPSMIMNLSATQTDFVMDVLGAFVNAEAVQKRKAPQRGASANASHRALATSGAASFGSGPHSNAVDMRRKGRDGASSGGGGGGGGPASPLTLQQRSHSQRVAAATANSSSSQVRRESNQQVVMRRRPAANPHAVSRVDLYLGQIEADLAELFRLSVDGVQYRAESCEATGSRGAVKVERMVLQHVGAQVEVADATTGDRRSARIDDLVDLLTVNQLFMDTSSPPLLIDEAALSTSAESLVNIKADAFRVAVSPTILFDTRELLYLPFCAKVLRQPIEPVPMLRLENEMTRLTEDLTLDYMHVLLTCNRKRCCYHLDLNGYSLIFTGPPSGQIVLNEGCELTISNGTIVIPGLYALGSFVSFAAATTLLTLDTCTIEKQYQSIDNTAFVAHVDGMRAAASAAVAAGKGGRAREEASPRATVAGALPSSTSYSNDGGLTIQQRHSRLVVDVACPQVVLQVLSEETPDLSTSLCAEANVTFTQDSENDAAVRRNVSAQLLELRSGENEQHTLLPTSMAVNFSGVENVSVAILFGPLEVCLRAVLLRWFVEIAKDFGAAFIEETTVKRFTPTVQLETPNLVALRSVMTAGECENCGQQNAYLSENDNTPGTVCYKCCTGRENMPATDFRVEIPLIDAVLLAASGDIGHAYVRNLTLCVDPNMDAQLSLRGALHNFSNAAAVWEPFVEQFVCNIDGSVHSHDYNIRIDRLDYVVSPLNMRVLTTLASDYGSTTTLQKRMRKKFRRQTQLRSEMGYNTAAMYVDEIPDDEDDRASARVVGMDDELTFGSTTRSMGGAGGLPNVSLSGTVTGTRDAGVSNQSIFDLMSSNRRESVNSLIPTGYEDEGGAAGRGATGASPSPVDGKMARVYARVNVENWCNATLLVNDRPVTPRGGTLRMKAFAKEVLIAREQPYSATDKGYLLSLANPALYMQAEDFLMETRVTISQDAAHRSLRRLVNVKVLPLHGSKTLICIENRLSCWLSPGGNIQDLAPGDRYYVRALTDLNAPLLVRPTKMASGLTYAPGITEDGKVATLQEVLTGLPTTLICKPARSAAASSSTGRGKTSGSSSSGGGGGGTEEEGTIYARVRVRQDAMRGGVPTFIIAIEPRYRLSNKLPYPVLVRVALDREGEIAKGRARPRGFVQTVTVEAMEKVEVGVGPQDITEVALLLEAQQPVMDGSDKEQKPAAASRASAPMQHRADKAPAGPTPSPPTETFTSAPMPVKNGFVKLTSGKGRELAVRIVLSGGNILLTTPFAILNHSDYPLQLRECDKKGEIKRVDAERNYSVLAAKMNDGIAACPLDASKDEFFVNVYSGRFSAKAIPLHVQQRGLILMEELVPAAEVAAAKERAKSKRKRTNLGSDVPDHAMLHLAYMSKVDTSGAILVTITPRWVVVNRCPRSPLYIAPTAQAGLTASEAHAAATAQVAAEAADRNSPAGTPTSRQTDVDAFKNALMGLAAATDTRLTETSYVLPVGPKTAEPLYITPYCIPELGYHTHILQSPDAPLYGCPVQLETIHNEVVVAYHPRNGDGPNLREEDEDGYAAGGGDNPLQAKTKHVRFHERDHYLEVSLVAQESYTFIVIEEPEVFPFLFLNRTRFKIELRDTAPKSAGRLMARAAAGCGTELILDSTVSTAVRVVVKDAGQRPVPGTAGPGDEICFDVGRAMSAAERAAAKGGLLYRIAYGEFGQTVVEIYEAKPRDSPVRAARASPPTPINVLLNMYVLTVSVVIPNRDILFAAITDTRISWDRAQHKEEVQFSIANFQVDNQTEISPRYESCILALRKAEAGTAISGNIKRIIIAAKALLCFDEVRLDVAPIALRVSDTLLVTLAQFARMLGEDEGASASIGAAAGGVVGSNASLTLSTKALMALVTRHRCPTKQHLFEQSPRQMDFMATRIILDKMIVNPLLIRLWLTRDDDESDFFRDGLHTKEASLLSMMIPSCEDVNISAPGLVAVKRSSRLGVILQWMAKSYTDGLFAQLQGVLLQYAASLPFIGAPVKLFSGIGSGAVRLFKEPVEGLATSPKAFAKGLARGSSGFAAGFAGGGLGAFSNLANAGSRLLSMGGGVSEKDRRKQTTWSGITSGLAGVVQRPKEGAAESGVGGFAKGAAHGLVGVFANPLSGLLSDVSRATGTVAKLVTDTYIPQTRRLRPIRPFHANGGVAQWRSVITVYQYERIHRGSGTWSSGALLSSVDGPEWYPCRREQATYGKDRTPVPPDLWALDRHNTTFDGWTMSTKYYGFYTGVLSPEVRVRRKRWTALVRPLPYSPMAFYLGISPGMARASRGNGGGSDFVARTASMEFGGSSATSADLNRQTTAATLDYVQPGAITAVTVEEAKARRNPFRRRGQRSRRSRSRDRTSDAGGEAGGGAGEAGGSRTPRHVRSMSGFFEDEEYADKPRSVHQRMQSWTAAGRSVGVKTANLRTASSLLEDDFDAADKKPSTSAAALTAATEGASGPLTAHARVASDGGRQNSEDLQRPAAPRSGAFRADRNTQKPRRDSSLSGEDGSTAPAPATTAAAASRPQAPHARSHSRHENSAADERLPLSVLSAQTAASASGASLAPRLTASEESPPTLTVTVDIYEYQKKTPVLGWGTRGLPSSCPPWQDAHGLAVSSIDTVSLMPGWRWTGDWYVVGGDGGEGGWQAVKEKGGLLRRRQWRRTMVKAPAQGTGATSKK